MSLGACVEVKRQLVGVSYLLLACKYCVSLNTSMGTSECPECVSVAFRKGN